VPVPPQASRYSYIPIRYMKQRREWERYFRTNRCVIRRSRCIPAKNRVKSSFVSGKVFQTAGLKESIMNFVNLADNVFLVELPAELVNPDENRF